MLWLDSVLAVPAIGIRIDVELSEINKFQDNILSFFCYLKDKYDLITIKQKSVFGYTINTPGPSFQILPDNIVADYEYSITQKDISGDFPTIEKPVLKSYSDILSILLDDIRYVFNIIKDIKGLKYDRIGLVAKTSLSKDSIPPGITAWLDYLGKPWGTNLVKSESMFFLRFLETDTYYNQCHHLMKFDETVPDKGYKFNIDWQRLFKDKLNFDFDKFISELESCKLESGNYFERFASGELDYE